MTEEMLTNAPQMTPLAGYLAAGDCTPQLDLVPYLGALTPQRFDVAESETGAFLSGAAVHDLGWLRRIAVKGEDRSRWLSGMVTNGVETLPDHSGAYNFVLNAQGRIQGDAYVWRNGDELELEVTAEQAEALLSHFVHFIIMDDVELAPLNDYSAIGLAGPKASEVLTKLGLSAPSEDLSITTGILDGFPALVFRGFGPVVPHFAIWVTNQQIPALWRALRAAGATAVGAQTIETLRVVEGIPAYGIDIQSRDLAQETGQIRALSFTKGCYLGQEIVERIRSRGQVHRHLRALELKHENPLDIPAVGTSLHISGNNSDAKPAGAISSVACLQRNETQRIFAIAMIRAEAETGNQPLNYSGGTAQILHSPPNLK